MGGSALPFMVRRANQQQASYPTLPPLPKFPTSPTPAAVPAPATSITNTADASPYLKKAMDRLDERYSADDTKRRIQDSNLGIMDAAALSAADQKGGLSRRGLIGSAGASDFLSKRVYQPAQREAAKAASNIELGQQQRLDNLTLGSTALVTAPDTINAENRRIALQQQQENAQEQQAAQQAQQSQVNQWLSLLGGISGGGY